MSGNYNIIEFKGHKHKLVLSNYLSHFYAHIILQLFHFISIRFGTPHANFSYLETFRPDHAQTLIWEVWEYLIT